MKRLLLILTFVALIGFAGSAQAASALNLLKLSATVINELEDEDFDSFADPDGNAIDLSGVPAGTFLEPEDGSFLLSMWNIQRVNYRPGADNADPTTNAFTAIGAVKVDTVTAVDADHTRLTFVPLSEAEWDTLIGNGLLPAGAKPVSFDTFIIIFDDGVQDNAPSWISQDADGDSAIPAHRPEDWDDDYATALGTKLWEFGFAGVVAGEFWSALVDNAGVLVDGSPTGVSYAANLNVTWAYPAVGGIKLLPHDWLAFGLGLHQLQLSGGVDAPELTGDGFYQTDTNLYIRPIPEPGSLALLGLGLAAFGGVVIRRRRK